MRNGKICLAPNDRVEKFYLAVKGLRAVLKIVMKGASLPDSGKLFHAVGPATANALLPSSIRFRGTARSPYVAECSRDR